MFRKNSFFLNISRAESSYIYMQDHSAQWKEWLAEYGSRLLLFARQQTRSEADAEDVLQSALVKTWKTHRGAPDEKVVSLAYTNIRRCAIDLQEPATKAFAEPAQVRQSDFLSSHGIISNDPGAG